MTRRRLRGRPRWPVRLLTAASAGSTWAGVVRLARGMPPPSVSRWSSIPVPFPPRAPPAPPPFPGGNSAIHGAILPTHHAALCCATEPPRRHRGHGAIRLPPLHPAMRGALRPPWGAGRDITPAATCQQDVQQSVQNLPKRRLGPPSPALRRCRGQDILAQAPLHITHTCQSSCHTALLCSDRTVEHKNHISGIHSWKKKRSASEIKRKSILEPTGATRSLNRFKPAKCCSAFTRSPTSPVIT